MARILFPFLRRRPGLLKRLPDLPTRTERDGQGVGDVGRAGKVRLERIRTFNWTATCRLVLLAVLVMLYLTWLLEREPTFAERLIAFGQPLPDQPDFLPYRLLTGLTEAITACFYLRRALL